MKDGFAVGAREGFIDGFGVGDSVTGLLVDPLTVGVLHNQKEKC